ncbi:uncharacterized protein [Palaemon carinicauda]|uniref:uncharacterized protein n=1 Tax=Palaemon carinicauda TaxID=392227 RepID=UPI0035B62A49
MHHLLFKTMKPTEETSSAVVKAPRSLVTNVPNSGRPHRRVRITYGDYDWLKMLSAVCGFAAVLLLMTGGILLVKQDYNNWALAEDECNLGIDPLWEEKVSSWSWWIVGVSWGIYGFKEMTTPQKCPQAWLEPLYSHVNVDWLANPLNTAAIIFTVVSLMFCGFGLKNVIRKKGKDESANQAEVSLVGRTEETLEEILRDAEKTEGNVQRESEDEDEKAEENIQRESEVEDEKAEEKVQRESKVEDGKSKGNIQRKSEVKDEKAEENIQRKSEVKDEKAEESVHEESELGEENKSQLVAFHKLFNEWRHDEALAVLQNIQSSNSMVEIWKAKCLVKMKRLEDARKLLLEQLKEDEENTELLLELGYLSLLTKDFNKSQDFFEKVLLLSPEGYTNWKRAMTGLWSIENTPKRTLIDWEYYALMILAFANVLIEKKWLYFRGMASAQKGDFSQAKTYFDEVMQRGGFRLAWARRAFCCVALGDFEEALEGFQQLLQEDGTFIKVVDLLERMKKAVDGECPYKVLSISEKDSDKKTKEAFALLISGAQTDEEKMKIGRAYARLSDYAFKLQYDTLRNEILRYSPN